MHLLRFVIFQCLSLSLCAQTDTLRLLFAGDIMGHTVQIEGAETSPGQYDYEPAFRYIKPVLERADLAIGNLELTLPGQPPYLGYPMFRSPDALAPALKEAGFDIIVTANNHCNDSRAPGLIHTIDVLRDQGLIQTGTFKSRQERDLHYPLMVYKGRFKLALLNYTYGTNSVRIQAPTVVNLIDTVQMARDLQEARARQPHAVIVVMHWGQEGQRKENGEQRRLARFLIRHGADLIVGAHPHVVQPIRVESVDMPDGSRREALVAYSLGNFIAAQQTPGTEGGILFQADLLLRPNASRAEVGAYGYMPVWRYIREEPDGKMTVMTLPVAKYGQYSEAEPELPPAVKTAMLKFAEELRSMEEKE